MEETAPSTEIYDNELLYEDEFKQKVEVRLTELERRLRYLEQNLEVQRREYTNA